MAGKIVWHDLTVGNAEEVRDFYQAVCGWTYQGQPMGDYEDYSMLAGEEGVAGVCHAKGVNAGIPPQWLIYVQVDSVEKSVQAALALGGKAVHGPVSMEGSSFCVLQDPAGAYMAIMSQDAP